MTGAPTLETAKVGVAVDCTICGKRKKPIGRSAPHEMVGSMCDHECPGYRQEPLAGDLWPGETDEDFGYPCGDAATRPIEDRQ